MALLKSKDVSKMDSKSRSEKLKDLKMELIKSKVGTHKATTKTKEIKRAIARINTFNMADLIKARQDGKNK
ncbi:50S ribosomal protein L29 [Candidatus Pacearchaeota archaeon]|nr:50S ribosomal protein L29 [Candidatus Pacearchaeota archaeon]